MEQKRKEEIRKSIIACDNDIVKLRSQAENLEEIIKNQKCTQKRFESECDKYEIKRQKKKIKLENRFKCAVCSRKIFPFRLTMPQFGFYNLWHRNAHAFQPHRNRL